MAEDERKELFSLRAREQSAGSRKTTDIRKHRKRIANILTVVSQKMKEQLHAEYEGKKYKPLDLRPKLTRKLRKALKPEELALQTEKQKARAYRYRQKRFAILYVQTDLVRNKKC